jgi:Tfp pilus assembly protein PilV
MTRGFSLFEIVIGSAIMSLSVLGIFLAISSALGSGLATTDKVQASLYAEEALEAMRHFRDIGWANIGDPTDGTLYYVSTTTTAWATSSGATPLITISDVYRRDSDNDIVPVGDPDPKTLDPNTRKIVSTVSFGSEQVVLISYLADLFE